MFKISNHLICLASALLLTVTAYAQVKPSPSENFAIVVHGGAGNILKKNMTPEQEKAQKDKLSEAIKTGYDILNKGGTSLDAIEAAIKILEDSPLYNAGKGSVFTNDGKNEMDASIMDGSNLKAGAVAGVRTIKNPISAVRKVMDQSPHVMMVGRGAEKFAKENGLEIVDTSYFFDENQWQQLQKIKETEKQLKKADTTGFADPLETYLKNQKFGTVGAVALDKHGNIAAATSTGGMMNKKFGRVGDSPIIGAGTYANNKTCGVSCTGHGEYFIRSVVAYDIGALMEYKGLSLEQATKEVITKLGKMGGEGGIISLDPKGNISFQFNTSGMYRGYAKKDGEIKVWMYKEE